jgi:hypothetical protein
VVYEAPAHDPYYLMQDEPGLEDGRLPRKVMRLSDNYPISDAVIAFLRSPTEYGAASNDNSREAAERTFLGQYISQVKATCVSFVEALLRLNSSLRANNTSGATQSPLQGNMAVVGDHLVMFVHCSQRAVNAENESVFFDQGRALTWFVDPAQLVGDNAQRTTQARTILLDTLVGRDPARILLFVRQDATPYVYCGRCSVLALRALVGTAGDTSNVAAAKGADSAASKATAPAGVSGARSAVKVTLCLEDYDALWAAGSCAGEDEGCEERGDGQRGGAEAPYTRMIRLHTKS